MFKLTSNDDGETIDRKFSAANAEIARLRAEVERLARAWEAKHSEYVRLSSDSAEYFDKSQRRMHELASERDTARNDALEEAASLAQHCPDSHWGPWIAAAIRALKDAQP